MQARVVTFEGSSQGGPAAPQRFQQEVLPKLEAQSGFRGALVLLDRAGGKLLGITLWDSEGDREKATQAMEATRQANAASMGATSSAEDFEVVAQVMPGTPAGTA
jgi:hypothetical protein